MTFAQDCIDTMERVYSSGNGEAKDWPQGMSFKFVNLLVTTKIMRGTDSEQGQPHSGDRKDPLVKAPSSHDQYTTALSTLGSEQNSSLGTADQRDVEMSNGWWASNNMQWLDSLPGFDQFNISNIGYDSGRFQ